MHKPTLLKPGDTVALIAPADRLREPSEVSIAARALEALGLRVKIGAHVHGRHGYLAGTDDERLADFHAAWADEDTRAIFCLRGRWGALRLLMQLDFDLIAANPKIIVGCGDVTALLVAIHLSTGLVTFHGPNLVNLRSPETRESLRRALMTTEPAGAIRRLDDPAPTATLRGGTTTGKLIGGSLAALVGLNGTPHALRPQNTLLFLEESEQRFSQFDRDLTTLRLSGITTATNGIAIGECVGAFNSSPTFLSLEEIFAEQVAPLSAPAFYGLPIGQGLVQQTLPIGVHAALDADAGVLEIAESGVAP
ncbi:MAG: LD-carboxypeptidase [Chloroflexi bacterium]|nr:LD-carboxypeptidase [Chloroflexota bacterium]